MTEPFVETKASPKTVEEQIKAKAWTFSTWATYDDISEEMRANLELVRLEDVLAVVNADRAEHNKQLRMLKTKLSSKHSELETTKNQDYIRGRRFQIEQVLRMLEELKP